MIKFLYLKFHFAVILWGLAKVTENISELSETVDETNALMFIPIQQTFALTPSIAKRSSSIEPQTFSSDKMIDYLGIETLVGVISQ